MKIALLLLALICVQQAKSQRLLYGFVSSMNYQTPTPMDVHIDEGIQRTPDVVEEQFGIQVDFFLFEAEGAVGADPLTGTNWTPLTQVDSARFRIADPMSVFTQNLGIDFSKVMSVKGQAEASKFINRRSFEFTVNGKKISIQNTGFGGWYWANTADYPKQALQIHKIDINDPNLGFLKDFDVVMSRHEFGEFGCADLPQPRTYKFLVEEMKPTVSEEEARELDSENEFSFSQFSREGLDLELDKLLPSSFGRKPEKKRLSKMDINVYRDGSEEPLEKDEFSAMFFTEHPDRVFYAFEKINGLPISLSQFNGQLETKTKLALGEEKVFTEDWATLISANTPRAQVHLFADCNKANRIL